MQYIQEHVRLAPHIDVNTLQSVNDNLKRWSMTVSQWNKKLHKLGGFCVSLLEQHIQHGILAAKGFNVVGVAPPTWQCSALGLLMILWSAQVHGMLKLAEDIGVMSSSLQNPMYRQQFVAKNCIPTKLWDIMPFPMPGSKDAPRRKYAPRSIFSLPTWKLDDLINHFIWRNVITFAPHPLKPLAHTVGRCPTLMVKESMKAVPFMSLPSLLGVRDMFMGSYRLDAGRNCTFVRERDKDNCYWNIDKKQAVKALNFAKGKIMTNLNLRVDLWFSIARGNDRHRDHVGKSSESAFLNIHFQQVYNYVLWDLLQNKYFCCDSILPRQGP